MPSRSSAEKVNQTDVDGLYKIMWENGNEFKTMSSAIGGKLKGLIEIRHFIHIYINDL